VTRHDLPGHRHVPFQLSSGLVTRVISGGQMTDSRGAARRRAGVLAVIALTAGLAGLGASAAGPALAAAPTTVAVTPDLSTTTVADAQGVTITGRVGDPTRAIGVAQCRGDVPDRPDGLTGTTVLQGRTMSKVAALCANQTPGSGGQNAGVRWVLAPGADGAFGLRYWVTEGTIRQDGLGDEAPFVNSEFQCDPATPCTLVVFQGSGPNPEVDSEVIRAFPLTFTKDGASACGAPTDGSVTGAGSFSMQAAVSEWAGGSCAKGTATPLLADYTQSGEGPGQDSFLDGSNDFAVTAAGAAGLHAPAKVPATRSPVYTPVAVQAAVVAFEGGTAGYNPDTNTSSSYPIFDISATMSELAGLFSNDGQAHDFGLETPLITRNPELRSAKGRDPEGRVIKVNGAPSTPDSTTLALTRSFTRLTGTPWKFGATASFPVALKPPPATDQVPLYSNAPAFRSQVLKAVTNENGDFNNGIRLYLTDSSTAALYGLTPVKIQNAAGKFVAPTAESVTAAVAGMTRNADGTLTANAANPDPGAYPLPLVQYALSPGAKFADTAKRDRLVTFLRYATGPGQQGLPAGTYPLTTALKAQAEASLAKIGATAPGRVPPRTPAPAAPAPSGSLPPASVGTPPGVSGGAGGPGDSAAGAGSGSAPSAAAPPNAAAGPQRLQAARPGAARTVTDAVSIPVFPGLRGTALGRAGPVLGLVALVGLVSLAAFATSGRSAGPLAARMRRRLRLRPRFAHRRS
jgi:ABC-type phosphate transport system substrate-binding protein